MMAPESIQGAGLAGAIVAGLITSVHCVGMCGPLVCGLGASRGGGRGSEIAYHGGRLAAYALVGMLAGAMGTGVVSWFHESPLLILPWGLVVALALFGLGLDRWLRRRIPRTALPYRLVGRARSGLAKLPGASRAVALGLLTPLLPCAPLYAMFGIGFLSGSPVRGAETLLAFGLGTLPLLWLVQAQAGALTRRLGTERLLLAQRGLALLTAGVLAWRLRGTLGLLESGFGCGCGGV